MWNPWRALKSLLHIDLVWERLPDGILGETDVYTTIWLDPRQQQARRRSTLAHELAHIKLGHTNGCNPRDELAASIWAARKLITIDRLADALKWTQDLTELADELWVDESTVETRLKYLHPAEIRQVQDALDKESQWTTWQTR